MFVKTLAERLSLGDTIKTPGGPRRITKLDVGPTDIHAVSKPIDGGATHQHLFTWNTHVMVYVIRG